MSKLALFSFVFFFFAISSNAQILKQGSIWCTEMGNTIDFKFEPPKFLTGNKITYGVGRTSSLSDENGNLLFYTQGDTVWNRKHQVMLNGSDLSTVYGAGPITSVIVPHPGDGQLYYIFIANKGRDGSTVWPEGFHYSVVDMNGDNGYGEVIQNKINLISKVPSLITVSIHADDNSFWVISHGWDNNKFYAFRISDAGISSPVISTVGDNYGYNARQMKVSPDGTKLGVTNLGSLDLYDFNSMTGEISNVRSLGALGAMGVEFSPNSELLYASTWTEEIIQFDVSTTNINDIIQSKIIVGKRVLTGELWDLQLAYNEKIYCSFGPGQIGDHLVSINNPNIKGIGCNYSNEGLKPPVPYLNYLPLSVQSYYRESPSIVVLAGCTNLPLQLRITSMGYADSLIWDFGDKTVKSYTPLNSKIVNHVYAQPGEYTVKVKKYIGNLYREISATVSVADKPEVNLGPDTILCAGENIQLNAGQYGTSYKWSTGAKTQTIDVLEAGTYEVEVDNGVCKTTDAIAITVNTYPEVSLGPDQILCDENSVELSVIESPGYDYHWSTEENTSSILVTESGEYEVKVSNGRCQSTDQINIQFAAIKDLALAENSLAVPYGKELSLQAKGSNIDSWKWIFGNGEETETDIPAISYSYPKAGLYEGKVVASNSFGCTSEVPFTVEIPEHLFIPNVFTPNGDGLNDTFEIQYNGREDVDVVILNRWGELIFSSDTLEKRWNGLEMSGGMYYYKVRAGKKIYKGWVSMLR